MELKFKLKNIFLIFPNKVQKVPVQELE